MRTCEDAIEDLLNGLSGDMLVEKPAKIIKVHNQYLVDVEYDNGGEKDFLYNVPVKHLQTNSAFVFLKLKQGDKGTIRFFDNDVDEYKNGSSNVSTEIRKHDINDNFYDYGFYPENEQYIMPDGEICIGLKNGTALMQFDENGDIVLSANNLTINATSLNNGTFTATKLIAQNGVSKQIIDSQGKVLGRTENGIMVE